MELENFSIDKIKKYSMWYMLDTIKDGPIELVRRTPVGDEPYTKYSCFKMNDGHVLIGFNHFMTLVSKHNFVAISNGVEEIVNIQMFENIMDIYDVPINNTDKGYFVFTDSVPIMPTEDYRCDNTMYGAFSYNDAENVEKQMVFEFDKIIEFAPIFSVNATSHLIYINFNAPDELKYTFANELELPICGVTISEALKLITEWATVASEPFNNQQFISQDAKDFISKLGFDTSLVDYQVDMHIAEFLKGNPDARKRPENVMPLSNELNMFIKKHMAYRCLSALISLYPDAWNIQEIIDNEEEALNFIHSAVEDSFKNKTNLITVEIFKGNASRTMRLYNTVKVKKTF